MKKQEVIKKTATNKKENLKTNLPKEIDVKGGERQANAFVEGITLPGRVVQQIADEVAKRMKRKKSDKKNTKSKLADSTFLDTSAIIDGRVFDLMKIGVFYGNTVVLESVLSEMKNIADSKEDLKKERGKKALKLLEEAKKIKGVKIVVTDDKDVQKAVDEKIIEYAKRNKGRIITCDYNLSQKAKISNVVSINLYEMANILKTNAVPGDVFWVKVVQKGKGENQGVGYLPDGTMIVVEQGEGMIDQTVKIVVARIIQTDAGKIFFGKVTE